MTIDVVTIQPDGAITHETIPNGCEPLQQRVGGWIEAVSSADGEVTLWCNEEGALNGMPMNGFATQLWYMLNPVMAGHGVLHGPVVVSGGTDPEGETLSIPPRLASALNDAVANAERIMRGESDE